MPEGRCGNVGTNFWKGHHQQNFGGEKMTKIGHNFFTTFNFDRKYLRKGSTKQISEKHVINYNPSFIRQKGWWTLFH